MRPPLVLTVAGSDAAGAAGVQADLKTFTALGVYGASALTLITSVAGRGPRGTHPLPPDVVRTQIDEVVRDLHVDVLKIGALGTAAIAHTVADAVRTHRELLGPIVLDPVMIASDGAPLISAEGAEVLRSELVPLATVLTPNIAEAAQLLGRPVARTLDDMREQALALQALGPQAVVMTGGGLPDTEDAADVVVHPGGTDLLRAARVPGRLVAGAGATYSAAIAAQLARIAEFERAGELEEIGEAGERDGVATVVATAREFVASATDHAADWEVVRDERVRRPLNHLITLDKQ